VRVGNWCGWGAMTAVCLLIQYVLFSLGAPRWLLLTVVFHWLMATFMWLWFTDIARRLDGER
jgi:hypothetical protein